MKRLAVPIVILVTFAVSAPARSTDATAAVRTQPAPASMQTDTARAVQPKPAPPPARPAESRIFFGGSAGLSFGDYFSIRVAPLVGYKLTRRASVGVKFAYEYIEDKRYSETFTANNYGGSVFARFRFHPRAYIHAEYATMSYEYALSGGGSERSWVPFVLLGGAYIQPISPRAYAYVEVLFDVLQDDKSPYKDWEPWISVGVSVGL